MASVNEDKELLRYAGDFRLELCNIISYRTDPDNATESLRINILPQLLGLSIVEDLIVVGTEPSTSHVISPTTFK